MGCTGRSVRRKILLSFFAFGAVIGCASYQTKVDEARRLFVDSPTVAVEKLEPLAKEEGRDQLVYLLDYATALQVAGRYADSAKYYIESERVADLQDYHSISRVAGSLVLNEEMVQYKGDDFEKVMINCMNAFNYLEMGQLDDALVEARRVNEKLYKLKFDGKKDFNQSPFAFYLSAMIWEADRKFDDAYIAYKNAYEVAPSYLPLREDLIRAAIKAQRPEELEKWKKEFPEIKIKPEWKDRSMGEVVLIFQQGWGPRKAPRLETHRFPRLVPVASRIESAELAVRPISLNTETQPKPLASAKTEMIYSIGSVAIKALDDDFGRLMAARVTGVAAKAVVADQLRQKNEALGTLAWIAMNIADRADLRQWSTLPSSFQIARIPMKPGTYTVDVTSISNGGGMTEPHMPSRVVTVGAGRKSFITWRALE